MSETKADFPPFSPPLWLRNGHLQTMWPTLFRRLETGPDICERLTTPDDDFLDLDWYQRGHKRLLIISHGLEGFSRRPYMLGMVEAALGAGWDALAWNFRSCSGEMNRQPRFYHSGATVDLDTVVRRALSDGAEYDSIALAGFSMGGNITLVYLGQQGRELDSRIVGATVFSVPCDLAGSADQLALPANRIYMRRFMNELRSKMKDKHRLYPDLIDLEGIESMRNFHQFDNRYTAPLHGFKDAEDYWYQCSSRRFIGEIQVPALIVNAQDDPFLSPASYPEKEVAGNPRVKLETPRHGGHVGFVSRDGNGLYWSERRAMAFLNSVVGAESE